MYRKVFIDKYLKKGFEFDEAKSEVDFAFEVLFNYTYKDFMLGKVLEKWQFAKLNKVFEERLNLRRPIQQIVGQAFFYGRKFFVNEYTLIPRPETELLIPKILMTLKDKKQAKILDIGTGTGCIPVTLVLESAGLFADSVDISSEALETARKNSLLHNCFERVNFFKSDLFENVNTKYDLIVSNPPYIPLKDKDSLQSEVRDFEPPSALFTNDNDGIEFYAEIISSAADYLLPGGHLIFELGINQSGIVEGLLKDNDFTNIEIIKDYNSIDRVICTEKC